MQRRLKARHFAVLVAITLAAFSDSVARRGMAQTAGAGSLARTPSVRVPFFGCKADGQLGPQKAPAGRSKLVSIPPEAAERLAYYQGPNGPGVLAPRGWSCFQTYGSNGQTLLVTPAPIPSPTLFSPDWKGISGPAVQLSISFGDTSGRFAVARIIARVFPSHKKFVAAVIAEGISPASDFPSRPYPQDKLTYKSKEIVEYQTPANTTGLGTDSRLQADATQISGVELLTGEELNLTSLAVRLPASMNDLGPTIIGQVEREVTK